MKEEEEDINRNSLLVEKEKRFDDLEPKFPPMKLAFHDLQYVVNGGKKILKNISGSFESNQMTAILGASGSGKTTLLNILAGLLFEGCTGNILFNDVPRDMKLFKKLSCYLTQDDHLRPFLTVEESMLFAAKLKLKPKIKTEFRKTIIEEILNVLGLKECCDRRTERLSGGQKKRFSLAMELINDPPVIFLDEPTTGLDSVSANKCVNVMKKLSSRGKLIICSIHQPSKHIFDQFDQVYFLMEGQCVYDGPPSNVVNHLSNLGLTCPLSWDPSDYLLEISNEPTVLKVLTEGNALSKIRSLKTFIRNKTQAVVVPEEEFHYPVSFFDQIRFLLSVTFLQMSRNRKVLLIQFINHLFLGLITGGLFFESRKSASKALENFFFYQTVMMFFIYTNTMTSVLLFPSEVDVFKKEYTNRWYSLKAYYCSILLRNIPVMFIYGSIFNILVYLLTSQKMDIMYFVLFSLATFLVSIASDSLGTLVGSLFNILHGSLMAPVILAPLILFSLYGIGYGENLNPIMEVVISFSFVRSGFIALCQIMLSNQPPLDCINDIFCYYRDTDLLLRKMGMKDKKFYIEFFYICLFALFCRVLGYVALKLRTKKDFEEKVKGFFSSLPCSKS